jgi:hypothetical protein
MAFAAFDALAGVIANGATVTCRLHTLTVQYGCRGSAAFVVGFPHEQAQGIVHGKFSQGDK